MDQSVVIPVNEEKDIAIAREVGRELAKPLHFPPVNQTRVITAVSELARNIYKYGKKGYIKLEVIKNRQKSGIRITAHDNGPGIENIQKALTNGYSTSGSLGLGLPGVQRMMDEFTIDSSSGEGTTITTAKWQ